MNFVELSKRLITVADYVDIESIVADIGTDHAYIPIYLVKNKGIKKVIAMDVNLGPIEKAKKNIEAEQLSSHIETRLSNGLEKIQPGEVDTILISGMGGQLIVDILEAGKRVLEQTQQLIVQPQTELFKVRYKLHQLEFKIVNEKMVYEEGKYYVVIKAEKGKEVYKNELYYIFGKCLIEDKDPVLKAYLEENHTKKQEILHMLKERTDEKIMTRTKELEEEVQQIKEVMAWL